MLAYAANRPVIGARRPSPNTLLAIVGVHVAALAVLMTARMEMPPRIIDEPTIVDFIHPKKPPPPVDIETPVKTPTRMTTVAPPIDLPPINAHTPVDTVVTTPPVTAVIGGGGVGVIPEIIRPPVHYPVKLGPRLATPDSELKPPYPQSKLLSEEEATLALKLTIDPNGRVVAVDPVGRADPAFLTAARRHLIAHWRYKPASEDGRPVPSSTVITLRFELDG